MEKGVWSESKSHAPCQMRAAIDSVQVRPSQPQWGRINPILWAWIYYSSL